MTQLEPHDSRATRPAPCDPVVEQRARLAVCANATSRADAELLLAVLGLVDEHGKPASPGRVGEVGRIWRD